jgi:hypothetical protein
MNEVGEKARETIIRSRWLNQILDFLGTNGTGI